LGKERGMKSLELLEEGADLRVGCKALNELVLVNGTVLLKTNKKYENNDEKKK